MTNAQHIARCAALLTAFQPVVEGMLTDYDWLPALNKGDGHRDGTLTFEYAVRFVETLDNVGGLMYHFEVRLNGGNIYTPEMAELMTDIGELGFNEKIEGASQTVDGLAFVLGDGDDALATFVRDGVHCIWLRYLPE